MLLGELILPPLWLLQMMVMAKGLNLYWLKSVGLYGSQFNR